MHGFREAVLEGTQAAQRLHRDLKSTPSSETGPASIDVFGAVQSLGVALVFRRLNGLLGAYFTKPVSPVPGILVSTERELHVQRFTAAHELGHHYLGHEASLDQEIGLWRSDRRDLREVAADAFASEFLSPKWLYIRHCARHGWTTERLKHPDVVYQLSLRLGISYEATCWGLKGHKILEDKAIQDLRLVRPKEIKRHLLGDRLQLKDPWAHVWALTSEDDGLVLDGGPNDVVSFQFLENASAGFLWQRETLERPDIEILSDQRTGLDEDCGSAVSRVITARFNEPGAYSVAFSEARPWNRAQVASRLDVTLRMFGKERGLPRSWRPVPQAA